MTSPKVGRILVVSRGLPFHGVGGMEAVAWDYAKAFKLAGAEVTVLTTSCKLLPADSEIEGVRVRALPVPAGRYSRAWWIQSKQVYLAEFAGRVDVVLSVSAGARAIASVRKEGNEVFVVQAHGTAWGEFVSKIRQMTPWAWLKSARNLLAMLEDIAYRRFDAFVAVGEIVSKDLQNPPTRHIVGPLPVYAIPNGVSPELFSFSESLRAQYRKKLGLADDAFVLLSASRLHSQKGVMEGVEAFLLAAKNNPHLHYVIVGAGPDESRLRTRVLESDAATRIHFVGYVRREELVGWLSASDLFIFTTQRVEGLPLNVLEARAAGLPVIISKHIDNADFGAMAVDPNDVDEVAQIILAATASVVSKRDCLLPEKYTLSYSAAQYLKFFDDLIAAR